MERIRVLLVDDDIAWQGVMGRFLSREKDIVVAGMVKNREEAIGFVRAVTVDVVLMDVNLTENRLDGIETAIEIGQICKAKIIMLTSIKGNDVIVDSFTAGAVNFLSKEDYKMLPEAIRMVHNKTNPYEVLLEEYAKMKKEEQIKELSPCEKEVYYLMEEGATRRDIQEKLNKSENTIKKYINMVLKKLDAKTSKEAVSKVKKKGIVARIKGGG